MNHPKHTLLVALLISSSWLMSSVAPRAAGDPSDGDWPQWRGPDRDGVSRETDWTSEGQPKDLWKASVGLGYSTVSVANGRLYTLGYDVEQELDVVFCLDAETGEEVWTHAYPAKIWNLMHAGGTLTTPTVDGDVVYTSNREGKLFCFDAATGEIRWERDLAAELELTPPKWGFAASPIVFGNMLVLNLGRILALEKESGETIWITEESSGSAYSTPELFARGDRSLLAAFNSDGLAVHDLKDGARVAFHEWKTQFDVNSATPIAVAGKLFVSSGLGRGCGMFELGDDGLEVVWESKIMRTKLSGVVLYEGYLYGIDEAELRCISLTGEEMWRERGIKDGAIVIAGGRLVCLNQDGDLIVAKASPDGFEELSRKKVLEGGKYWSTPVVSGGRIYCRNSKGDLVCRDHRVAKAGAR